VSATLKAQDLRVTFRGRDGERITAVDNVSLTVPAGGSVGLVGESGSGKTTVARVIAGVQVPDSGTVSLDDTILEPRRTRRQHRAVQLVFQDPFSSLNPRRTVRSILRELLRVHELSAGRADEDRRCAELMELVGLPSAALDRRPTAFSGGQRQRIAIARALVVQPDVIVADEPVSALDVSIQATILQLFADLRAELNVGLLLISHNLVVVRHLCDEVAVMYRGEIVEHGDRGQIFSAPQHAYTRTLLDAVPRLGSVAPARGPKVPESASSAGEDVS
jgi:peptide/nickel transport system ATP-binding protein